MTDLSPKTIATKWIEKWSVEKPTPDIDQRETDLDWDIPRNNPELCLQSILEVLSRIPIDPDNRHFQVLAAGPLENLLVNHGETCMAEVEVLARRDPSFRKLLNGVWTSRINSTVVERLSKYMQLSW